MSEHELIIEEAGQNDAKELLTFLQEVTTETPFLSDTQVIEDLRVEDFEYYIEKQGNSKNNISLILKIDNKIFGYLNMEAGEREETAHILTLFIVIKKGFQNLGLGHELMAVAMDWASQSEEIKKVQLDVQVRNQSAVHLYKAFGFEIEGTQKMGLKTKDGEYLDIYLMGKILNG